MASTISNINIAKVDERVVGALRDVLPALSAFSYRCATANEIINNTVRVPLATDPSVATKTPGTKATGTGGLAGVDVTLDTPKAAGWDVKEGEMPRSLLENYWIDKIAGSVYALASYLIADALSLVTAANYGNVELTDKLTVAPGSFDSESIGKLYGIAKTKIKQREMSFGMNATYAGSLIGNSMLALIQSQSGRAPIETGIIPPLVGIPAWVYPGFPDNSQNLGGAVFGRAAIALALAQPDPLMEAGEGDIIDQRMITEPDSGLTVMYRASGGAGGLLSGECWFFYGKAKGQDAIVRLVSN